MTCILLGIHYIRRHKYGLFIIFHQKLSILHDYRAYIYGNHDSNPWKMALMAKNHLVINIHVRQHSDSLQLFLKTREERCIWSLTSSKIWN